MENELEERPSTALTVQQRAVQALGSDKAREELTALAAKSRSITEVKNPAGRDQAHSAGMVLKRARVDIQTRGKAARDDATKFSKAVIAEENSLVGLIEPEEQRLIRLRDAWDEEQARIKAEAARKEAERVASIRVRIERLRSWVSAALDCATVAQVDKVMADMGTELVGDYAEFTAEAQTVFAEARARVLEIQTARLMAEREAARMAEEQEAERRRLAAERAELERQRVEAEAAAKVERERVAAEQAAHAARLAEERRAFEAEQAKARAEAAKRDAEDRARRDEEDRKAREARAAEERRLAGERAELERQQRALREAEDAKAAEARRIAQEAEDAAAAAERKRLDDEAAAARAERQRQAEAEEAARIADKRKRDAADAMLAALQMVAAAPKDSKQWLSAVQDAIAQASSDPADIPSFIASPSPV